MRVQWSACTGVLDPWPWLRRELLANCNVKQQLWETETLSAALSLRSAGRVSSTAAGVLIGGVASGIRPLEVMLYSKRLRSSSYVGGRRRARRSCIRAERSA